MVRTALREAVDFDWSAAYGNIQAVRPGMPALNLSAKTSEGMTEYLDLLFTKRNQLRTATAI